MTTQPPDRLFRPVSPAAQAKGERVFCAAVALLLVLSEVFSSNIQNTLPTFSHVCRIALTLTAAVLLVAKSLLLTQWQTKQQALTAAALAAFAVFTTAYGHDQWFLLAGVFFAWGWLRWPRLRWWDWGGLAALAAYTLLVPGCRGAGIAMVLLLVLFLLQRALPAFFESRIWHGMALAAAPLALGFSLLAGRLFDPDHPTATPLLDKLNGLLSGRFEIWHHVFWGYPLYHPEQDGVPGWYHDAMPKAVTLLGGLATDGDEHHAIDNSFLAIPMNKGVLGAVVIGVIFLLLMWRLCQNRCTGETLFLTVILVYFLMENKCFLFSADPFILLLPAALFPAKGKPLPVVCPPVTRGCI